MFMRFVRAKIKPEELWRLQSVYEEKIAPVLRETPGCLYACLIQDNERPEECISMTIWDSLEHIEAYEKGGVFERLLNEIRSFFSDSSEWKVQLTNDLRLEYAAVPEEPIVISYGVAVTSGDIHPEDVAPNMHLRIVSMKIRLDRVNEFLRIYRDEILPALRLVPGCRFAYLADGFQEKSEFISITVWANRQDAERYEQSGTFEKLRSKVQHTFTDLYQWKMGLSSRKQTKTATSDDMSVTRYSVVTGSK